MKLVLLVGLLLSDELRATAGEPAEIDLEPEGARVVFVDVGDPAVLASTTAIPAMSTEDIGPSRSAIDLSHVTWTVDATQTLDTLASKWGLRVSELVALNPELAQASRVDAGQPVVVFRERADAATQSIGSPNRGRLRHGIPLPEGEHWLLRTQRRRAFGTRTTIESLVTAFNAYATAHPGGPPIRVGEISGVRGGRAPPHKSHRTGRDVDIAYIPEREGSGRAGPKNFDVERNWALLQAIVETGHVQQIYVSAGLQKVLRKHAAKTMSRAELAVYFWDDAYGPHQRPILKHQNGHRDHLHVRFRCEPGNRQCRS